MSNWVSLTLVFLASCGLTWLVKNYAIRRQLLDLPVARSSHVKPVPVGGGLAFIASFYLACAWLNLLETLPTRLFIALWGGLLIAGLGLLDDIRHLRVTTRLAIQFLAALWTVFWLDSTPTIQIANWLLDIPWLIYILSVLAMLWLINLYNFMDGIDGLAGMECCFVNAVSLLIVINTGDQPSAQLSALLGVSVAGFLVFNWPPARIFMGDAGSGFLGYCLGTLALISMLNHSMTLWTWLLLLGVFVVDATITLARRINSGQSWSEGHNSHAYQHAVRQFGSHRLVTTTVLLINLFWLAPLALYATAYPGLGVYLTLLGMVPLALLAMRFRAGKTS